MARIAPRGVMGVGMGYAVGAAVESGKLVVAVVGDSSFGFSGMEPETICRYQLPVTAVFNNGGVYKGDETISHSAEPAPTVLLQPGRHGRLIEAFGGNRYYAEDPKTRRRRHARALASDKPAVIDCLIDPTACTESGHASAQHRKHAGARQEAHAVPKPAAAF